MIKKVLKLITVFMVACTFISCTVNKPEEKVRTITVNGNGNVNIVPDQVSLRFLVKTTEWNVNTASEKNAAASSKVIEAIKAAGVGNDDISTYDYKITQDNSNTYPGKYTVTNTINVLIRNIDITGNVIDTAIVNGANGLYGFQYSVSDNTSALRQARTLAIQNAQDTASLLAGASGCRVNEVLNIVENGTYSNTSSVYNSVNYDAAGTSIKEGTVSVTSYVTITYSLEN